MGRTTRGSQLLTADTSGSPMKGGKATEKKMQVIKNGIETCYRRLSNIYHKKKDMG